MKSILLLLTVFFTQLTILAQIESKPFDVIWGNNIQKTEGFVEGVIGGDKDNIYVLSHNEHYYLNIYSLKDFSKVSKKQIIPPKNQNFKGILLTNKGLILLSQFYNNRFKINQLFAKHLTLNGLTIGRSMNLGPLSLKKNDIQIGFRTYLSSDRSKILTYIPEGSDPKENMKFRLKVVDSDLNDIWERSISLPFLRKHVEILNFFIDDDNFCYLSLKTEGQLKHFIFRHDIKQIKLEDKLDSEGKKIIQFDNRLTPIELPINEKEICNSQFQISPIHGDLLILGFYSKNKSKGITGSFYARVDKKSGLTKDNFLNPFSAANKSQNDVNELTGKSIGELYQMNPIQITTDGGYLLSLEERWVNIVSNNKGDFNFTYLRNDLYLVKLSSEGRPNWNQVISKRQSIKDKLGGGLFFNPGIIKLASQFDQNAKTLKQFSAHVEAVNDNVFILYNCNNKNFEEQDVTKFKYLSQENKGLGTYIRIDENGSKSKGLLFSEDLKGTVLRPDCISKQTDQTHVIIGEKNGNT